MIVLFENKNLIQENRLSDLIISVLLYIISGLLFVVILNYLISGNTGFEFYTLIAFFIGIMIQMYLKKTILAISYVEKTDQIEIRQKNGFKYRYSLRFKISDSHLSPLTEDSDDVEFDIHFNNKYVRLSSSQDGVHEMDIRELHKTLTEKYQIKQVVLK